MRFSEIMKRRTFINLSLVAAASGVPSLFSFKPEDTVESVLKKPVFLSGMLNESILREIGIAYKAKTNIGDPDQLIKLLLTDSRRRYFKSTDPIEIKSFIEKKIEFDVSQENMVVANGWVISVTEARQCALLSIN